MTQSIIIQVGQCGNQIGYRFWDAALKEHFSVNKEGVCDESLSSFFENVDHHTGQTIPIDNGKQKIQQLKARAVLVDMEEGVVNEIMKSPLRNIFDNQQLITDVSGAGNNWAVGHYEYGEKYREKISEVIRKTVEKCDCLQCFFCIHSMGGGTGSGVGTYVLRLLQDEYADVFRFVTAVYPSEDDDVITSPYNSALAMYQLTQGSDAVIPIENQALMNIVKRINQHAPKKTGKRTYANTGRLGSCQSKTMNNIKTHKDDKKENPFDSMNNIVADLILNLTSSSRFEGSLNIDLNEISMNLVPFPKLHYLTSSITPLYSLSNIHMPPRILDQMFTDAFSKDYQLLQADPKHGLYLACSLMLRGDVEISDIRRNIDRLRTNLNFIYWNQEGWKTGLCSIPPVDQHRSLLALSNNTCMQHSCLDIRNRFMKLYKRKAHIHHYTKIGGFEDSLFTESIESLDWLISEYETLESTVSNPPQCVERLQIA